MIHIESFSHQLKTPVKAYLQDLTETHGFYLEYQSMRSECITWDKNLLQDLKIELSKPLIQSYFFKALEDKISVWDFHVPSEFPNVRFAFASLYQSLLTAKSHLRIPVNGLLSAKDPDVLYKAQDLIKYGITVSKLKVSPKDNIQALNSQVPLKWRLDGNLSFTLEEAVSFCSDLQNIDYFEEPLSTPQLLESFFNKSAVRYALDENKEMISENLKGVSALVIKPSLLGDFSDLKKYIGKAPVVISSSYESDVGLKNLMNWAHFINPTGHHGLFTFDVFKTPSQLTVQDGCIYEK